MAIYGGGSYQELAPLKTTKASHKAKGADNEFNAMFGEVEIHNEYSLETFVENEIDFEHLYKKLNLHRKQFEHKLTFRVRKIKGRSVCARYYNIERTIVVDVKHISSFVHELGHLLDYEWCPTVEVMHKSGNFTFKQKPQLAEQEEFATVKEIYTAHFKAHGGKSERYYLSPTEIFARSFELYVVRKLGALTIVGAIEKYSNKWRKAYYPIGNETYLEEVDKYFNTLFGL